MSDDLISRKALIDEISYKFGLGDSIISNVIWIIERHKTAYDADKVVEQIREYADNVAELGGNFLPKMVIEIVKSGGVADE